MPPTVLDSPCTAEATAAEWLLCSCCGHMLRDTAAENCSHGAVPYPFDQGYGMCRRCGGDPTGPIAEAINKAFGSFKDFQAKFNDAGTKQFGSGWAWLAGESNGTLKVVSTPNQDNPISQGLFPILGNDVWEHAYYLKYNNRRPEYLAAWWNVVNWDEINKRYEAMKAHKH